MRQHLPGVATLELNIPNPAPIRPTAELARHHLVVVPERDREHQVERPARVEDQTQLDRLERRKSISEEMADAGRRYFSDAYYSGTIAKSGGGLERVDRSPEAFSERYVAAIQRRRHAIRALGELYFVTEWVCVDDHSAQTYAIRRGEHPMAGIELLRVALTQLAKHYGILKVQ